MTERDSFKKDGTRRKQESMAKPSTRVIKSNPKKWAFKAKVYQGSNLPWTKSSTLTKNIYAVRVSVGCSFGVSPSVKLDRTSNIDFGDEAMITGAFEASSDPMQMPDLVVTLLKGDR